jgi:uncharacterized membrane protein YdbT with pleckstrin-like domain
MVVYIIAIVVLVLTDILAPIFIIRSRKNRFTKQSLQFEEEILTAAKTHWVVMLNIIIIQLLITFLCIIVLRFADDGLFDNSLVAVICVVAVVFWLLTELRKQILCWCREFVVTTKRIIIKAGILARETREFRFEKVESCDVKQGVMGRVLGYGSIVVRGVGGSGVIEYYVVDPFAFRQYIIDKITVEKEALGENKSQPAIPQYDAITELQAYKKLLDEGVITKEDFDKKKREILERK